MARKPHKWGIILYNMAAKLPLSRKPYLFDFEANMSPTCSQDTSRTSPIGRSLN